ncbi:MAG: response regulator [Bacteroidetes bacterium]|nr:response regulator [Bacteroidota bacterium]
MDKTNRTTIFIVEDNEMFAETLRVSLEIQGYTVYSFRSGEQMISSWEEDPDIILLDFYIESPNNVAMNGDKILRFIRRISKSLPVVMLTSNSDIGAATSTLKQGAVDFILKDEDLPVNLEKSIHQILDATKLRREMAMNKVKIKKYRQHFLVICLLIALAGIILLWLSA